MDKRINSHCIRIYFNDQEYALLSEHESVLGISKQQLVRKVLIDKARPTIINAGELLLVFDHIGEKIALCHKLIYMQLEKMASQNSLVPKDLHDSSIDKLLADYLAELKNLEQAIRLLLSKMKT